MSIVTEILKQPNKCHDYEYNSLAVDGYVCEKTRTAENAFISSCVVPLGSPQYPLEWYLTLSMNENITLLILYISIFNPR